MRKTSITQLPLTMPTPEHPKAKELKKISEILEQNSSIYDLVLQDLRAGYVTATKTGADGMSAEQVLRAAIIKQIGNYSYRELEFHLPDSKTYCWFCKIKFGKSFKKSCLQRNIKLISDATWEQINRILLSYAGENNIEKGRKVRVDCTVVESNIHHPYDSELLFDSVRVLDRTLTEAKNAVPDLVFSFSNHERRAKKRCLEIMNAKDKKQRKNAYRDLIQITENTIEYGQKCLKNIKAYNPPTIEMQALVMRIEEKINSILPLAHQVVCQAKRRVLGGESVPADEKIVSIFEPHTDIIIKDKRDTHYGHKICLTGGASNLILDCVILEGNPADSKLTIGMLDRQEEIYGRYPLKASFDGGFTSRANCNEALKKKGLKDVCFSKGRGLEIEYMCRSLPVYKQLRRFRAGIESGISWLKRCFGLDRCTWKGFDSFKSYVWSSIVSANLLTMARKLLA